uniref:Uncharacterized protein n=1 Tax=Cannabis sativa TaxID=3483 RepID=A0A803PS85_CANSA
MSQKRTIRIPKASDAMARAKLITAKKLKTEGSKQVSESNFTNVPLTHLLLILQAMLFIRENYPTLEKKNKKLIADNASLKLDNGKHVEIERELKETIESLKGELEKVKQELIDEKKRAKDLAYEAEQVALTAVIKTHGELMIESQARKNEKWDVVGEIETYRAHMGMDFDGRRIEQLEYAFIEEATAEILDLGTTKDREEPHENA